MPDQLQLRGGTTSEHNSFTGAAREVTVDTTKKTLVVHDGSQAGGTPLMKESGSNSPTSLLLGTGGNTAFRIHTDQKVGVGVNTPISKLDVNGVSGTSIKVRNTGTVAAMDLSIDSQQNSLYSRGATASTARDFRFVQGSSEKIRVLADGKVGIGTTSPIYPLDVTGSIRATSQGRFGNGTASEPAYSFSGDSDTGMYRSTTNILAFSTAGTERLNIDAQGNATIKGGSSLFFHNGFNDSTSRIQNAGSSNNSTLRFLTKDNGTEAERMIITSGGAVGIGVTGPSGACKLEIGGKLMFSGLDTAFVQSARPAVFRTGSTSGSYPFNNFGHLVLQSRGDGSNRDIVFATGSNGANKTVVTSAGNVGIGNTSPAHKLEVAQNAPTFAIRATQASSTSAGKIQFINLDGNSNYRDICQIEGRGAGNGGYGDLIFKTQFDNTLHERLRIDKNGNVRVGSDAIAIAGVGTGPTLAVNGTAPEITLRDSANNAYVWISADDIGSLTLGADQGSNGGSSLIKFKIDGNDKMRLNSLSQLSLGTTSNTAVPQAITARVPQVELKGSINTGAGRLGGSLSLNCDNSSPGLFLYRSQNVLTSGLSIGNITFCGYDGDEPLAGAQINVVRDGAGGNNSIPTAMTFSTTASSGTTNTYTERMRIDKNGRVGIGRTSSLTANLDVHNVTDVSGGGLHQIIRLNSTSNNTDDGMFINISRAGTTRSRIEIVKKETSNNETDLVLKLFSGGANSERFRIVGATGRVGIGTSTPTARLDVVADARIRTHLMVDGATAQHNGSSLYVVGSYGDSGSQTCAKFDNSDGSQLLLLRNDKAFYSDSIYHGTTSSAANVHVGSNGYVSRSTSSRDYKKNIKDALWGLAEVLKLRPVTFQNNAVGEFADDHTYGGFISEELHESGLTEFVQYDDNNKAEGISYGHMVALLTNAIKELSAKVEALEAA